MNVPQLREQFATELRRHRLPRAYIERLLAEWDDHLQDLQDERTHNMDTARTPNSTDANAQTLDVIPIEARLGDPTQLAAIAAKQYHNRSFLGRHPIVTFLLLPLPLVLIGVIVVVLSSVPIDYVIDLLSPTLEKNHPLGLAFVMVSFFGPIIVLPPLCTMLLLCRIARRNTLRWRWPIAGCALVALYCAQIYVRSNYHPTMANDKGIMLVGWEFIPTSVSRALLHFLPKFAMAMGVGLLLIRRAQQLQKPSESDQETVILRRAA